ncbi:MAG: MBL fold metallo-hydrolase [Pseudomonadota bacterium]
MTEAGREPEIVAPGVWRLSAPNPSPMTFTGTQSYVVAAADEQGPRLVVDPGPDDPGHLAALAALSGPPGIAAILITHTHLDHTAGAARLKATTGAPVIAAGRHGWGRSAQMQALAATGAPLGGGEGADLSFMPDIAIGDALGPAEDGGAPGWLPVGAPRVAAIHTPGHLSNHLSFVLPDRAALFTGDAVMGWSTTLVSPPDGDMAQQMATLERLAALVEGMPGARLLPGHGPVVDDPARLIAEHRAHRDTRRAALIAALSDGPADASLLARRLYTDTPPALIGAAARNVLATLLQLEAEGVAAPVGPLHADAQFMLA